MITIEDIAKESGVSIATVSRVLNSRGYVAESTREIVLKAAKKLGRSISPDMERKRVLVAYVSSGQGLIEPIMAAAEEYNLSLLYKIVPPASLTAEHVAFDGDFDGMILIDSVIDREELSKLRKRMPVVECRNYNDVDREVSVMVDDVAMGYRLTRHLIETGKTRIATVQMNKEVRSRPHAVERARGYRAALTEAGLLPAKTYYLEAKKDRQTLPEILRNEAGKEWDALIYPEPLEELVDLQQFLRKDGHSVPNTIALAAFGDSPVLESGGISVVCQPIEAIVRASLFMLDSLMNDRLTVTESMQLRLQPKLIVRGSTQE